MTPSVDLTVIMATFNGARFIDKQLQSLSEQTAWPRELIVADDGSTDGTLEKVERFRAAAPFPVRVVCNAVRLGYGGNFLAAARLASSRYVAFCDQDDVWLPIKLATSVEALDRTGGDLFVHAAQLIDDEDRPAGFLSQRIRRSEVIGPLRLAPWGVFYGFSMVFRRALVGAIDPDRRGSHTFEHDGPLSHDLWVYFVCASLGTVVTDRRPLALYRRHGGNATPDTRGTLLRLVSHRLGLAAHPRLRRHDIARHRAALLRDLHGAMPGSVLGRRAMAAAAYWEGIAKHEESRTRLYTTAGAMRRAAACAGLLADGGYRSWPRGGLGRTLLLKDLLTGVLGVRRVTAR